jgi:hypothetical protein
MNLFLIRAIAFGYFPLRRSINAILNSCVNVFAWKMLVADIVCAGNRQSFPPFWKKTIWLSQVSQ